MYYLQHVHPASASAQSVYLTNFLPSGPCLCRVLHTSLSFLSLAPPTASPTPSSSNTSPLTEVLSVPINGRILRVAPIRTADTSDGKGRQRLAVLTDHHQPRLIILRYRHRQAGREKDVDEGKIEWCPIETEAVLLLDEMGRQAAESGLNLAIEQGDGASFLFSHTHAGILKVVPLQVDKGIDEAADLNNAFGVRCVDEMASSLRRCTDQCYA